jgi:hypothetical protein
VKIEIYPRAEADIIHQFRYYLVDQRAPAVAFRFRNAVRESVDQLKPIRAWVRCSKVRFLACDHGRLKASRRCASTTLKAPTVFAWSGFFMASETCGAF